MRRRIRHSDIQQTPDRREPLERARDEWLERHENQEGYSDDVRKLYQPALESHGVREPFTPYRINNQWSQPGRWWPKPHEVAACCKEHEKGVERAQMWPMTNGLLAHCATYLHIATKHGVDVKALKQAVKDELERRRAVATMKALGGIGDDLT